VMIGKVSGAFIGSGLTVETTLDPAVQPFLHDHQIDGTPVLPGVMGTEAFAEIASVLCPGYAVVRVENVEFRAPFKFYRGQPATLHLGATGHPAGDGVVSVSVQLKSVVQPRPDLPAQERVHFSGRVRMAEIPPGRPAITFEPPPLETFTIDKSRIYRVYFHGPAYQVIEGVRLGDGRAISVMAHLLPADVAPPSADLLMAPRLIELCFQTAGVLEMAKADVLGLPTAFRSVAVYRQPHEAEGRRLFAVVARYDTAGEFDAQVVDERGHVYVDVSGYRTIAFPIQPRPDAIAAITPR